MYTEKQYDNIEKSMIELIGHLQKLIGVTPNRESAKEIHNVLTQYIEMNFQLREKNFHQSKGEIEKRFNDLTRTY